MCTFFLKHETTHGLLNCMFRKNLVLHPPNSFPNSVKGQVGDSMENFAGEEFFMGWWESEEE